MGFSMAIAGHSGHLRALHFNIIVDCAKGEKSN